MPFSGHVNRRMKKDCVSLQVHKPIKNPEKLKTQKFKYPLLFIQLRKRVCLFTSSEKGSVTIETLISLFVFMMVILFMGNYMMVINTEMAMQINITNIARNTAKKMFYMEVADEVTEYNETLKTMKSQIKEKLEGEYTELLMDITDEGYLQAQLIKSTGADVLYGKTFICDIQGANVRNSSIENGKIDFIVNYKIKMPMINKYLSISHRCFVKDWTGTDITTSSEVVYITKSGKVYHRSKECSHLIIHISKTTVGQAENKYHGRNYSGCEYCVNKKLSSDEGVFITEDGDRYHTSLRCRGLTRRIIEIDINQIEGRKPCSECGQGE